jgi:hypothetical protein
LKNYGPKEIRLPGIWPKSRKLLFSNDGSNLFSALGPPKRYQACRQDCEKFYELSRAAKDSFANGDGTRIFGLSTIFLAIRNFATCFSLGVTQEPDFSRHSALRLGGNSLAIAPRAYSILERARILCTRGQGEIITDDETQLAADEFSHIEDWMTQLLEKVGHYGT